MAGKEVNIFIVDLGSTTSECHSGRTVSDLEYGMQYIWDKIATVMSANRVTWRVGVIGFRTDDTDNPQGADEGYENISILQPIGQMDIPALEDLRAKLVSSETEVGDAVSAIAVATQLMDEATQLKTGKPGKYTRKIFVLTDGQGSIDEENIEAISQQINEIGIELTVIGIDFDDEEYGYKEEDKSSVKRRNERILAKLVAGCTDGRLGTAAEAIELSVIPDVKETRPYKTYEGRLALGDFEKYPETALYLDVIRYTKTKIATPPSASSFVTRGAAANGEITAHSSHTMPGDDDVEMADAPDLTAVKTARSYEVNDPSGLNGKKSIEREELERGYMYGRTAVAISESDEDVTKLETIQSFSIIGFIPSDKYERYLNMGQSHITIAQPVNDKARLAFSSLVHALAEVDSYAVARIVVKNGKEPLILLLAPVIEPDLEALIDIPLPFAEDIRIYRFPPLDKVIGSSGATITKHRYLPSESLVAAMSDYVDGMDISSFGTDEEGKPAEYMPIEETYSPALHRINQAIRKRAIYPDGEISEPAEVLVKWSTPPAALVASSCAQLEKLVKASSVTKVPPKKKGRRGERETIQPLSGLDVDALLNSSSRNNDISRENAIPEFRQMLASATKDETIAKATRQMGAHIRDFLKKSTGGSQDDQVFEMLAVFRREMVELEFPDLYNNFCADLKKRILSDDLGDQKGFWFKFKRHPRLGLIDSETLDVSEVSEEQAAEFFR